jgi:hypothetical protein
MVATWRKRSRRSVGCGHASPPPRDTLGTSHDLLCRPHGPTPVTEDHAALPPHVIVLFGGTGDLARRKLLPGLFHLSRADLLPECFIVATALDELDDEEYRDMARKACDEFARGQVTDDDWAQFPTEPAVRARVAGRGRTGRCGRHRRGRARR